MNSRTTFAGFLFVFALALSACAREAHAAVTTKLLPDGVKLEKWGKADSADFNAEPLKFYRFECRVKSPKPGFVAAMWRNPDATWGRDLQGRAGDLRAEDYQPVPASEDWQTVTFYSRAQFNAVAGCLHVQALEGPMEVGSASVSGPVADEEVLAWAKSISGSLDHVDASIDAGQAALLTRTALTLNTGGRLRIAFLGDSIMQDAANSPVDLWLEQFVPAVRVQIVTAIGGGAGMERWNHPEKFPEHDLNLQAAVIDQQPDLVLIGGISTKSVGDTREIIQKIRAGAKAAGRSAPDIVLMTGPFGDFRKNFVGLDAASLRILAGEMRCAFFDLRGAWLTVLQNSHREPDAFYRDSHHGNALGKQSQGRLIASWLESLAAHDPRPR